MNDLDEYINKLPPEVSFSDTGLLWKEQYICSFLPRVHNKVELESDGKIESFVRLSCFFTNEEESNLMTLPLSDLEATKWFDLDQRCQLNPDCSKAMKYLAFIIGSALYSVPVAKQYHISRLGAHIVEDVPLFCTGNQLVWPLGIEQKPDVAFEPLPDRLVIDLERYSERQAVTGMLQVVNLSPDAGNVIFSQCLLSVLRAAYLDICVTPRCIVFIVGKTGLKKTTYAAFQTQLYNRDKGIEHPMRLNASCAAAETILYEKSDCAVVLDDLFPANSSETKRNQEKTLIELTRIVGDSSGRARMSGNQVVARQPRCGVIVTGEYLIGTGSDAARLLPVKFSTPIDPVKLHQCQKEPLLLSTFYHYFITWFISHYHEIRDLLAKWLTEYRKVNFGIHARLQETFFCLSTAYKLFLTYCTEKKFISPEQAHLQNSSFQDLLTALVKAQNERATLSEDSKQDKVDYLELIRTLFKSDSFRLADSVGQLKEKHDGLIYNDRLCLRSAKLMKKIHQFVSTASLDDVVSALIAKEALMRGKEKRSIQISGCNGKRFFAIPLKKLR